MLDTAEVLAGVEARLQGLDIEQFFEEAHRLTAERDPEKVISDGLAAQYMLGDVELTNISDEYYFQTVAIQELIVELLLAFDTSVFTPESLLSWKIYLAFLQFEIEWGDYRNFQYPATYGFWGWPGSTETFFTEFAPLDNAADADNYLDLLNQLGRRFRQVGDLLDARASAGVREPELSFDYSRSLIENMANSSAPNTPYYTEFNRKISALDAIPETEKK